MLKFEIPVPFLPLQDVPAPAALQELLIQKLISAYLPAPIDPLFINGRRLVRHEILLVEPALSAKHQYEVRRELTWRAHSATEVRSVHSPDETYESRIDYVLDALERPIRITRRWPDERLTMQAVQFGEDGIVQRAEWVIENGQANLEEAVVFSQATVVPRVLLRLGHPSDAGAGSAVIVDVGQSTMDLKLWDVRNPMFKVVGSCVRTDEGEMRLTTWDVSWQVVCRETRPGILELRSMYRGTLREVEIWERKSPDMWRLIQLIEIADDSYESWHGYVITYDQTSGQIAALERVAGVGFAALSSIRSSGTAQVRYDANSITVEQLLPDGRGILFREVYSFAGRDLDIRAASDP